MKTIKTKNNIRYYEGKPNRFQSYISIYKVDVANEKVWSYNPCTFDWRDFGVGDFNWTFNVLETRYKRLSEKEIFLKLL